jgi:hypothetical protein
VSDNEPVNLDGEPVNVDDEPDSTLDETFNRLARLDTYIAVVILLVASFIFTMSAPDEPWANMVSVVLQGATLLLATRVSRVRPRVQHALEGFVVVSFVIAFADAVGWSHKPSGASALVSGLLGLLGPVAIWIGIRRHKTIDVELIAGLVCIYLMLGLMFAFGFRVVAALSSGQFFATVTNPTPADFTYFSFVTQTTVGYGDLTSVNDVGRSMAVLEALMGQLYLVTVVALAVSNIGSTRPDRTKRAAQGEGSPSASP